MQVLDCLVSYFGLDEKRNRPTSGISITTSSPARGSTAGSGVASITALAIYDKADAAPPARTSTSSAAGVRRPLAKAIQYLDAYHAEDRLRKVQSDVRGLGGEPQAANAPLTRPTPIPASLFQANSSAR